MFFAETNAKSDEVVSLLETLNSFIPTLLINLLTLSCPNWLEKEDKISIFDLGTEA
jgi:hypothetical protein